MRVHLIDVGAGAATLIEFPCAAMLVDTGGESGGDFDSTSILVKYLDDFFERRGDLAGTLDLLVLTHPHVDHTRGVRSVLERYRVKNAVTNGRQGVMGNQGDARQGPWTAYRYGHPRWATVEKLVKYVRGIRPTVTVPVAFGATKFYDVPDGKGDLLHGMGRKHGLRGGHQGELEADALGRNPLYRRVRRTRARVHR